MSQELKDGIKKNLPNIPLDFVTNDYDGYFELMKDSIPLLTPEWTDMSDTDQGIVILQLLSYGLHVLGYYQERVMQENILELARTKKGILTACKFLGYEPSRQNASVATLTITKDSDYLDRKCVVPKGAQFSTNPNVGTPIIFETMEELIIPSGETQGKVNVIQGVTIRSEIVGVGNGKSNQKFVIPNSDVLIDSLDIFTNENDQIRSWGIVDNFLDSVPNDRHYTTSLDEEYRTVIHFGDGIFGRRVPEGMNVYVTYRIGGGRVGDLAPNLINYVYETDMDLNFIDKVYNEQFSQGGEDYEDLERARLRAPKHYRSREHAVTPLDFEDIAELVKGVYKAKAVETYVTTKLYLYLLGTDYTAPTEALCKLVEDTVNSRRVGNVDLEVLPCVIKEFQIKLTIYVHDKFDHNTVKEEVRNNLTKEFHISNFNFGDRFYANKSIDVAFNTAGVKNVVLDPLVTTDQTSNIYEVLKLTDVNVEVGGI